MLLPKSGITRARLDCWLEPVEDQIQISMELDSTEMIKRFVMAGLGLFVYCFDHLPGGSGSAQAGGGIVGAGTADPEAGLDLSQR